MNLAKTLFLKSLERVSEGNLEVVCPQETYQFGQIGHPCTAVVAVHNDRFFQRAVFGGDIGVGEAYVDGDWSTPDLVAVMRLGVRNIDQLEPGSRLLGSFRRALDFVRHRRRRNTIAGSQKNIAYHYDLGNDFYRLFLDQSLAYSCAYYKNAADSLERAQWRKYDVICRKLQLASSDHLLEIGTGWGGFAAHAVQHYGCQVTTTTISRQQHDYARRVFAGLGNGGNKIELLFQDYRNLQGQYDKIVSIEMFEAVGYEHYDDYFEACDRLLKPEGMMLLQTITIQEARFAKYLKQSDWIKKYIFPGAELASVTEVMRSLARVTKMQMFHMEDIGTHYALTLKEWRHRFLENLAKVHQQGFDERFGRLWEYYLAYCEAAFSERYISDAQLLLCKLTNSKPLVHEPSFESTFCC
jgi:cyclopropane-fatty-acyl-phospholipid synthase